MQFYHLPFPYPSCNPDIDRSPSPLRQQRMSYRECDRTKVFLCSTHFWPSRRKVSRVKWQIAMMIVSQLSVSLSYSAVKRQLVNNNELLGQNFPLTNNYVYIKLLDLKMYLPVFCLISCTQHRLLFLNMHHRSNSHEI